MPLPWGLHYAAAKAGVLGFSRSLAALRAPHNIRSNAVCPSGVRTNLQKDVPPQMKERMERAGFLDPADIARAVVHLVESPDATGEEIFVVLQDGQPQYFRVKAPEFEAVDVVI
jgi:NAD(P)-dependent dehydrogenase (short-subunit alcohol dehydrogenase family)